MVTGRTHKCGGILVPRQVTVLIEKNDISLSYVVPGLVCEKCHDELIERDTALKIQSSQMPTVFWHGSKISTSRLDAIIFGELPAPAGTRGVAVVQ